MKHKFRGYTTEANNNIWVYGSLAEDIAGNTEIMIHRGRNVWDEYKVDPESVGMNLYENIYEGDIFVLPGRYPFFDEGKCNYIGVVEYIRDAAYCGWYYDLIANYKRVRGSACGESAAELDGANVKIIGNLYESKINTDEGWKDGDFDFN